MNGDQTQEHGQRRPRAAVVVWVVAMWATAGGCSVDIPTEADAYTCEKVPCPTGGDVKSCTSAATCPQGAACQVATCTGGLCALGVATDGTTCDDGDTCTVDDTCKAGLCVPGATNTCDDAQPCTTDSCNKASGCLHGNMTTGCEDGDACTSGDKCGGGACLPGPALQCDDGSLCTDDACNKATGCVHVASKSACDDGEPCTTDSCGKASGCVHSDAKGPCDDGDTCTKGDACGAGWCISGPSIQCADGNTCTTDSCNKATGCVYVQSVAACDDGDACTEGDMCAKGSCKPGKPTDCDDGEICTTDACDKSGTCSHTLATGSCDDGDPCTVDEFCAAGSCAGGTQKTCDDGNTCTTNSCDAKTGCVFTASNGPCDDADPCTAGDTCVASSCKGAPAKTVACCGTIGGKMASGQCTFTNNKGHEMSLVPDGLFWMGCNSAKATTCATNEVPQHAVDVTGFWLDVFEVTAAQYKACVSAGVCATPGTANGCTYGAANKGQHPVNCVTWTQAKAYCAWSGGDLPTEAQWEKAARGGCEQNGGAVACQTGMRTYPWGEASASCAYAVIFGGSPPASGCGTSSTWAVGKKPKGMAPYGTLDMIGGVFEWVRDGYDASYYSAHAAKLWPKNPQQTTKVTERVLRGGSWSLAGSTTKASYRGHFPDGTVVAYIGFRCMRALK